MSKILFLSLPSHGNVNPTLGLVDELVRMGEQVIYFSSEKFKNAVEATGAVFKCYNEDLDIFKAEDDGRQDPFSRVIASAEKVIDNILYQVKGVQFDYIIHSAAFPFTKIVAHVLQLPTVSSLAVFAGLSNFFGEDGHEDEAMPGMEAITALYAKTAAALQQKYGVEMPADFMQLLLNKAELNFVYTSEYFIAPSDKAFFDDTYKFVGPPVYSRDEHADFPFEKLHGKKVIYISLGTVFGNFKPGLYKLFFESLGNMDAVIVLAAYNVDLSSYTIPLNFIVRNYVPQTMLLKHVDAAVTHGGMNSISDLIYHHVPFVAIPLGADQPELAKRAQDLGAAIALDAETLTASQLKASLEAVMNKPAYLHNIHTIRQSFIEAGGYKKAVSEIFEWKKTKKIKV